MADITTPTPTPAPEPAPAPTPAAGTDINSFLQGIDIDELMKNETIAQRVQSIADQRVTQAVNTAKQRWQQEAREAAEAEKDEAKKLARMTADERARYEFDKEKSAFEAEKAKYQHNQLVLETSRQMIDAGLPDLGQYVTGADAETTAANIEAVTKILSDWKSKAVNVAMRGTTPQDTTATQKLTRDQIMKMSPAEINDAWAKGLIDTKNL